MFSFTSAQVVIIITGLRNGFQRKYVLALLDNLRQAAYPEVDGIEVFAAVGGMSDVTHAYMYGTRGSSFKRCGKNAESCIL